MQFQNEGQSDFDGIEPVLRKVAAGIRRRGLEVPVSFLLEMHKPLSTVAFNALLISRPLAILLMGRAGAKDLESFFASRRNVDKLLELLREQALPGV
ncbi:MAG: hypothetical protein GX589_04040 [Deltaproteobacteria bacterium]|nr:hypothetical protein [Deltaproteobacteria bacterium]